MRIGIAFGSGMLPQGTLNSDHLKYASQLGVSDIVLHLPDSTIMPSVKEGYFSLDDLQRIKALVTGHGLHLEAIENFPVAHWYDILLDGPGKKKQMENLKRSIVNMGKSGISVMGYYFSLAGVWGRTYGPFARGNALTDAFIIEQHKDLQEPIPNGEIWGEVYTKKIKKGFVPYTSTEEVWNRLTYFLKELVPVAEEAGVRLASHPDDPPVPVLRQTGRLITHPDHYQRLLDIYPSYYNALQFCQGTLSYMAEGNIYETIKQYASQGCIAYVHMRNNKGRYPHYTETFMDEGDWDIIRCLKLFKENGFDGVIIPDHTPGVNCSTPYQTGFAHAIGYLRAGLQSLNQ